MPTVRTSIPTVIVTFPLSASGSAQLLSLTQELRGTYFKRGGDVAQLVDRDVPLTAFDERDVGAVRLGALRERLLRQSPSLPTPTDREPDPWREQRSHRATFVA